MSQGTTNMIFFTEHYAWNIFFRGESVCFYSTVFSTQAYNDMFSSFVNIFFLKHAAPYPSHILLFDSPPFWIVSKQIFLQD